MSRICPHRARRRLCAAPPPALAQFQPPPPELENRIPAPLPPPAQPPIINGPLAQSPPPGVYGPPTAQHVQRPRHALPPPGRRLGLKGPRLDAYARSCANAN